MATKMLLPLLGQTMEEGTITKWFKNEGETIDKGEPLLEVMTDKVNMEVEAPISGTLLKIVAPEQAVVPVKELIAIIGSPGEDVRELLAEVRPPASSEVAASPAQTLEAPEAPAGAPATGGRVFASPRAKRVAREHSLDIALLAGMGSGPGGRIVEKDVLNFLTRVEAKPKITPLAGKVAADLGVDLADVAGSGPGGKIMRDDVLRAQQGPVPFAPGGERPGLGGVVPFTGIRKAVADAMTRSSQTAAAVTLVAEVDMGDCVRFREQVNRDAEKRLGVKISFTDLIVKAAARAIEDHRIINATLDGDRIVIHDDVHIGVAVAIEGGLVAPVIKSVRSKPLHVISAELRELAEKARSGRLSPADMQGGTFTITNLGTYGVDMFSPIINPGQAAILGVCRIVKKPAVVNDQMQIRPMMNLCLTFDHRIVDGAPAAEYLARVKDLLENPDLILT